MKLYVAPGPNSYRVRIFMAEKGITLPLVELDYDKREHKSPEFLKLNSLGQVPVLTLDDGTVITESVAICRYLEAAPSLLTSVRIRSRKQRQDRDVEPAHGERSLRHHRQCRAAYQ